MTIEETIEYIQTQYIDEDAKEIIIESLQYRNPLKPYIQQVEIDYYEHDCMECPSCDSFLGYASECEEEHYQLNYCPSCGQKLDWELDN